MDQVETSQVGTAREGRGAAAKRTPDLLSLPRGDDATACVVRQALHMLRLMGRLDTGRVLVLEPRSAALARLLREHGFRGACHALARHESPNAALRADGYDHVLVADWLEAYEHAESPGESSAPEVLAADSFDVILASDALRFVPLERLTVVLSYLSASLTPRGCLIVAEPSPPFDIRAIESALARSGLLLAADVELACGAGPRVVATFQLRGGEESRLIGLLRRVTYADLERDAVLRQGLVTAYRAVFGGEEWREWARCVRLGCGRQYSRQECEALDPPDRCVCGWSEPLAAFHTAEQVLARLRSELGDPAASCCYVRPGRDGAVDGFMWGYDADVDRLAVALLSGEQVAPGQSALRGQLRDLVAQVEGGEPAGPVYYQSELGVAEGVRSLSLVRGLFTRVLQCASARGARVVVTRTSTRSSAYRLLLGIGMRVLYTYPPCDGGAAGVPADGAERRIVLGGDIRQILSIFCGESDRRLAVRIARELRRGQGQQG